MKFNGFKIKGQKVFKDKNIWTKLFKMCGLTDAWKCPKSGKLCDLEASQVKKNKFDVKKVVAVNSNFTNPWKIANKARLYCLASGFPV